jgi:hypothetical protein
VRGEGRGGEGREWRFDTQDSKAKRGEGGMASWLYSIACVSIVEYIYSIVYTHTSSIAWY